eukprot:gene1465-854_t
MSLQMSGLNASLFLSLSLSLCRAPWAEFKVLKVENFGTQTPEPVRSFSGLLSSLVSALPQKFHKMNWYVLACDYIACKVGHSNCICYSNRVREPYLPPLYPAPPYTYTLLLMSNDLSDWDPRNDPFADDIEATPEGELGAAPQRPSFGAIIARLSSVGDKMQYYHTGIFLGKPDQFVHLLPSWALEEGSTVVSLPLQPDADYVVHFTGTPDANAVLDVTRDVLRALGGEDLANTIPARANSAPLATVKVEPFAAETASETVFSPQETVQRAFHLLGESFGEYNLLKNNCQHFVMYCKYGRRRLLPEQERLLVRQGVSAGNFVAKMLSQLSNRQTNNQKKKKTTKNKNKEETTTITITITITSKQVEDMCKSDSTQQLRAGTQVGGVERKIDVAQLRFFPRRDNIYGWKEASERTECSVMDGLCEAVDHEFIIKFYYYNDNCYYNDKIFSI